MYARGLYRCICKASIELNVFVIRVRLYLDNVCTRIARTVYLYIRAWNEYVYVRSENFRVWKTVCVILLLRYIEYIYCSKTAVTI